MAVVGSMVGLVLLVLRKAKKLPRNFIYVLYSILLLRLVCPFGIVNGFSFLNLLPKGVIAKVDPATGEIGSKNSSIMLTNAIQTADTYDPLQQKSNGWTVAYQIGGTIWLIISVVILFIYLYWYIKAKNEFKKSEWIRDRIYQSKEINSPITMGIIKPVIILPIGFNETNPSYRYVIAHEQTHIRKKDNLWRMVAILLTCVYWFNPLIWMLQKSFFTDMELACDESTVRALDKNERKNYAKALLEMSATKPVIYAAGFVTGSGIKVRIKRVVSYKQVTLLSGICLLGLFLLCAICLLTN